MNARLAPTLGLETLDHYAEFRRGMREGSIWAIDQHCTFGPGEWKLPPRGDGGPYIAGFLTAARRLKKYEWDITDIPNYDTVEHLAWRRYLKAYKEGRA